MSSLFRPTLETLEGRRVPAAFARFGGDDAAVIPVHVRRDDFTLSVGRVLLSFDTRAAEGSSLDPAAVRVGAPTLKSTLSALSARADVAGSTASRTIIALGPKSYVVRLPAGTADDWELQVSLTGDVDGDFRVTATDLERIRAKLGKQHDQAGYESQADANGDGIINLKDWQLARLNLNAATRLRPFALVAGIAPESDGDGNGIVLGPRVELTGQTTAGASVTADLGANGSADATTRADSAGRFRLAVNVAPGVHDIAVTAADGFGQTLSTRRTVTRGDVVLDWNAVHMTAIRDYTFFSQVPYPNRIVHTNPPAAARNLAMVHAAMYDAINAAEGLNRPFYVALTAPPGTSASAAAAAAAHRVLRTLYPKLEQLNLFDAALAESLASVPNGPGKDAGVALGQQVADAILAWRDTDGSKVRVPYTPGTAPGDWAPTLPDFIPALVPQWPNVKPFVIPSVSTYLPPPPPALDSAEYAASLNEVKELGRFDSATRTAEQTEIALFWADGPSSFTPPGHWNQIAQIVAIREGYSLAENARLFLRLNAAMADAGIASWDAKYEFNFWRPIDAIRDADLDSNAATTADPNWLPLLKTPPFPSYTSGHSTFSAAAAAVLTAEFGAVPFTSTWDAQEGFTQRPLLTTRARSFANFEEAALEASRSRVYGGIHFDFDSHAGLAIGQAIGEYVASYLLP